MGVVDGVYEGGLYRAEGCRVTVLGKFALGHVMAENSVCSVRLGAIWWLLSGGAGLQWDVPHAIFWSRKPVLMTWLCFNIFTSDLVKMATQPSSQSCPMDMSESVVM